METLEQMNNRFLKTTAEIEEYMKYLKEEETCLKQPIKAVHLERLSKSNDYLKKHQSTIKEKIKWAETEWQLLTQSRTFQYDFLGRMLATMLSKQEGEPYFYATRLVKHTFQIDEVNRPFYQVICFVTDNQKDLKSLLLDRISPTMYPFYVNHSPIMKPLPIELENELVFEDMIRKELELRGASNLYVVTENTISAPINYIVPENQALLTSFPFSHVNQVMEKMIVTRRQKNAENLTEAEVLKIIDECYESTTQLSGATI